MIFQPVHHVVNQHVAAFGVSRAGFAVDDVIRHLIAPVGEEGVGHPVRNALVLQPVDRFANLREVVAHALVGRIAGVFAQHADVRIGGCFPLLQPDFVVRLQTDALRVVGVFRRDDRAGYGRRAAEARQLFDHHHVLRAIVHCGHGSRQTRAAAADDQHLDVRRAIADIRSVLFDRRAQGIRVSARLLHAVLDRRQNRLAGDGRARYRVHRQRLMRHDVRRNLLQRAGRNRGRFGLLRHLHIGDGAVREGHFNRHRAVHAVGGGGVRSRVEGRRECRRNQAQQHRQRHKQGNQTLFHREKSLLSCLYHTAL